MSRELNKSNTKLIRIKGIEWLSDPTDTLKQLYTNITEMTESIIQKTIPFR